MQVTGIIAEYNPFHNGHGYHLRKSGELTAADRIVRGYERQLVQRGEPACFDKYLRAEMALRAGADMVLELPVYYAASSAEYFAAASIALLNATGITDNICFGSEAGLIPPLERIAALLTEEPPVFKSALSRRLEEGRSYPSARKYALQSILGEEADAMDSPNNILGVAYLQALQKTKSAIKPYTFKRSGQGYHSGVIGDSYASATAIRRAFQEEITAA